MVEESHSKQTKHNLDFYRNTILGRSFFTETNRVNCLLPINADRDLVIGTDDGIYLINQWRSEDHIEPQLVIQTVDVTQIDILEESHLFMVLSNGNLEFYPIEVLNATEDQDLVFCEPKKVEDYVDFFKIGISLGRPLVCSVNTTASSTNIKIFEAVGILDSNGMGSRYEKTLRLFKVSDATP
ncbi:RHO1 GDP-GTP exchange protein 2 [Penicillium atrosanguineum]|uniref:RHO1 GDP-GTP exchange protein 2 n=1 Tax=Penicillium atrosanguineum TaxID=1132637 RepID=A0A9W9GKB9_9EURO|nr:uncharacterized protein N7443_006575 [Penicillium atrosanguineum]KAJ5123228.1 RHO1 GDP-GTP exchange protein 2 [Penicillium atrosanguineum]KAJ5141859.1 RHO1 GDP-GTP exchange protein 2 [Penicillium atrosanguineum]KAJ5298455.1 hypothetical protein N7443_006575 [Penicillium atrosanguineum]KAJ5321278.1 RHO1 GDP-GTP exchange protein 2 [Penicillium atrosanguineum]